MLADVHFEEREGMPIARIRGEIDMSNVGQVSVTLQNAVAQEAPGLLVDFTDTTYLDSAGLHFIFDLGKRLRDRGQRLYLVVPPESPVTSALDIVRVESIAIRCETLDQAVEMMVARAADVPRP